MNMNDNTSSIFPFTLKSIPLPIRFKLADNDEQDLQFPLQIPQDENTIYYSYRKQIKIQFVPDGTGDTIIQNLRVYFDTGKYDSQGNQILENIVVRFKVSQNYTQQSVLDVTEGLGTDSLNQLDFSKLRPFVLVTDIVYNTKENQNITLNTTSYKNFFETFTQKYFGNQPYLYLIVGLTSKQEPGVSSQFNIFYVYDEI